MVWLTRKHDLRTFHTASAKSSRSALWHDSTEKLDRGTASVIARLLRGEPRLEILRLTYWTGRLALVLTSEQFMRDCHPLLSFRSQ
jgi:hypothetical protein